MCNNSLSSSIANIEGGEEGSFPTWKTALGKIEFEMCVVALGRFIACTRWLQSQPMMVSKLAQPTSPIAANGQSTALSISLELRRGFLPHKRHCTVLQ